MSVASHSPSREDFAALLEESFSKSGGIEGTVVDVKVFTRKGADKDARSMAIEQAEEDKLRKNLDDFREVRP